MQPSANLYEFGAFQLDPAKRLLRRLDGTPVPLTSRVFETLLFMVEHHDAVLDKERIMEAVWPDSIVEENNLAQAISKLRQVFGETPGSHSYIVTVPGRGYRFVAEVTERTATPATPESTSAAMQPLLAASDTGWGNAVSTATTQEPIDKPIATPSGGLAIERPRRFLGTARDNSLVVGGCHLSNCCHLRRNLIFCPPSQFARECAHGRFDCPERRSFISAGADPRKERRSVAV